MTKIIKLLPNSKRYEELIHEYESRESREAKFAKAIDCLDSCIRNLNDNNKSKKDGFTEELIRKKYKAHIKEFEFTDKLFEKIMKVLVKEAKV